eukprot:SAG11_NODE_2747_length_3012_cov_1.881909_1_plen_480_part_00
MELATASKPEPERGVVPSPELADGDAVMSFVAAWHTAAAAYEAELDGAALTALHDSLAEAAGAATDPNMASALAAALGESLLPASSAGAAVLAEHLSFELWPALLALLPALAPLDSQARAVGTKHIEAGLVRLAQLCAPREIFLLLMEGLETAPTGKALEAPYICVLLPPLRVACARALGRGGRHARLSRTYARCFPAILRLADAAFAATPSIPREEFEAGLAAILAFGAAMRGVLRATTEALLPDGDERFLQRFLLLCLQLELGSVLMPTGGGGGGGDGGGVASALTEQLRAEFGGGAGPCLVRLDGLLLELGGGGEGVVGRARRLVAQLEAESEGDGLGGRRLRRWLEGGWGQWWPALLHCCAEPGGCFGLRSAAAAGWVQLPLLTHALRQGPGNCAGAAIDPALTPPVRRRHCLLPLQNCGRCLVGAELAIALLERALDAFSRSLARAEAERAAGPHSERAALACAAVIRHPRSHS